MKKGFGFILAIIGIVAIFGSFYVKNQVAMGEQKISRTETQMDMGDKLLSLAPQVQEQVEGMTGSIQEKVQEGKDQVIFYSNVAKWLEIGGIVFLVLGVGVVFCRKKRG